MLDRFIEFLTSFWDDLIPCKIMSQWEKGILMRLGKYRKTLEPGLVWKIPFVDEVLTQVYVTTTLKLTPQTLPTKDGKQLVIRGIVKYELQDIKTFLLEVTDAQDALGDMTQGAIKNIIFDNTYSDILTNNVDKKITDFARKEAVKWGIKIWSVTTIDLGEIRTIRIINDSNLIT